MSSATQKIPQNQMKQSVNICLILLLLVVAKSAQPLDCDYGLYLKRFPRNFEIESKEYLRRKMNFANNCTKIQALNNDPNITSVHGTNNFTDMGDLELNDKFTMKDPRSEINEPEALEWSKLHLKVASVVAPSSLDYRAQGKVTSVKDQGHCGSCWAFASIAVYESLLLIKNFPEFDLSEEESLECTTKFSATGRQSSCSGGYLADSMKKLAKVGAVLQTQYPYNAYDTQEGYPYGNTGICREGNRIKIGETKTFMYSNLSLSQIRIFLFTNGPLMVGINANYGLRSYQSGIYNRCPYYLDHIDVNHAVQLYGYDQNGNWLIKNQWGTGWGVNGFGVVDKYHDCGINWYVYGFDVQSVYPSPYTFNQTIFDQQNQNSALRLQNAIVIALTLLLIIGH